MALPETDLRRIRLWARERVPEDLWSELKVEADVSERYVDIVEVRPSWGDDGEHTRFPIARLRCTSDLLGVASGSLTIDITEDNLNYMRTEAPLLAPIFRSDGQARLLSTLLLTGDELSLTDLAERAGLAYPTVHREVARLVDADILSERQVGRSRLIRANEGSPLVGPLREILTVATGPVVMLAEELGHIDGIESAFVYGSFAARMLGDAGPPPHDIDVMVLGEPDVDAVYEACTRVEAAVHRPVNPTILTPEEFTAPSGFLDNVRSGPAVAVIGELQWR